MKNKEEIEKMVRKVEAESGCGGSEKTLYPGMSYEQGVVEVLLWVIDEGDFDYPDE